MIPIDRADDARVDVFRAMRARESDQVLWAEGPTVIERLSASGLRLGAVLVSPAAHRRLATSIEAGDAPVYVADQTVINAVVGFDLHRGAIAVADRPVPRSVGEVLADLPAVATVVVLEGVNDAENLGAIARSARALGADALLLDPTCADPYYRRSVRVSMGEVLHLAIARAPIDELFAGLDVARVETWALTPQPDAIDIGTLPVPDRLAIVAGAEGPGLSSAVLDRHRNVRIPVRRDVDSLNVGHAVAAALAVVQSSRP
jgi:tRNA G18 (ribose-2'-O)-methylase SpoU